MAAIADLPKPAVTWVSPALLVAAQSNDGRLIDEALERIEFDRLDRGEVLAASMTSAQSLYEPVPLAFNSLVRVKYENVGELKPPRYDWDE